MKFGFIPLLALLLAGCASAPPSNTANICSIFQEKEGWRQSAQSSVSRWGAPIALQMAIINQESGFIEDARPPRKRFFGIPLWRASTAYGYGQANDMAWESYVRTTGNRWADRDDFADATDFIGWYIHQSHLKLGVGKHDGYNQYLAYHEGLAGFRKGNWRGKSWLLDAARRVAATARRYQQQLSACRA